MTFSPVLSRQMSHSECGPVALQIALSCFGVHVSSEELTEVVPCGGEGWSVRELCEVALRFGIHAVVMRDDMRVLLGAALPIVVLADGHYVVVYKVSRRKVYVADPAHGRVVLDVDGFLSLYGTEDAVAVQCSPAHPRSGAKGRVKWGVSQSVGYVRSYLGACGSDVAKLIAVVVVVGAVQSLMPFISRSIVDEGLHSLSLSFVKLMTVASAVLLVSSLLGTVCQSYVCTYMTYRIKLVMLSEYFEKLARMMVSHVCRYNVGDIMQRLRDSERIQTYLANVFFPSLSSFLFLIAYLLILLHFNESLFWVAFAFSALFLSVKALFLKERKSVDVNIWNVQSKCNKQMVQCYNSLVDIKLFNLHSVVSSKWNRTVAQLQVQQLRFFRLSQFQDALSGLMLQAKDVLITYLTCSYVLSGELTLGSLFAVQYLLGLINAPLNKIVTFMDQTQIALVSLQRVALFNEQPDEVDATKFGNGVFVPRHKHITLQQVSYVYPDGTAALRSLSLRFLIGQKIGVVGKSGCGKSTLLKVLCGIATPTSGEIFIGNANVKSMNWNVLRRDEFGVLLQENSVFEGSILENIVCSNEYDETRLVHCVEMAHIRDEIERLPMGYRTNVGDGLRNLSAGQKQRLLIARALYQMSKVYLFDEMANGLSDQMERRIVEKIDANRSEALRVYVTHRGESIRNADLILVLDEGRLVDIGKHDDLINKSGYYKSLFV